MDYKKTLQKQTCYFKNFEAVLCERCQLFKMAAKAIHRHYTCISGGGGGTKYLILLTISAWNCLLLELDSWIAHASPKYLLSHIGRKCHVVLCLKTPEPPFVIPNKC